MAEAAVQAAVRKAERAEAELARAPAELQTLREDLARAKAARDQAEARLAKGGSGAADHFRAALSGLLAGLSLDDNSDDCLLYTSPSPRDGLLSRMPSSA